MEETAKKQAMIMQMRGNGGGGRRKPQTTITNNRSEEELKLASLAISFNMAFRMQERAIRHDPRPPRRRRRRPNPTLLARSLKKEFDSVYGPAWHCGAGMSFGSFVTHSPGGFIYFSIDSFSFLLFKTEVQLI